MSQAFNPGTQRRQIEDAIVAHYEKVNFQQKKHAYLEDETFWDFVFSWYELVHYYENHQDTAIGAHMLELYAHCGRMFKSAAQDRALRERRRDKAADALYQMTYYVNRMLHQAERNGIEAESDSPSGSINWRDDDDTKSQWN